MNPHYEIVVTHRSDGSATVHLHYNGYPCRQQRDCADDAATTACIAEYVHLWRDADVRHVGADGKAWTFSVGQRVVAAVAITRGMLYPTIPDDETERCDILIPAATRGVIVHVDPGDTRFDYEVYFGANTNQGFGWWVSGAWLRVLPQRGDGLPAQTLREGGEVLADDEPMTWGDDAGMPTVWASDHEELNTRYGALRDAALDVLTGMTARTVDRLWQLVTEE